MWDSDSWGWNWVGRKGPVIQCLGIGAHIYSVVQCTFRFRFGLSVLGYTLLVILVIITL